MFSAIRWAPTSCPNCRCRGREGSAKKAPGEEGATSLNSPGVCSQIPRRTRSLHGSHALWAQPGFRAAGAAEVLLSVSAEKDLEMSPSDVISDGVPVLHHKQGFILWPQTI